MNPPIHSDHYAAVADQYDDLYSFFYRIYGDWLTKKISTTLDIKPPDRVVDVGGGTGHMAGTLHEYNHLEKPILCVEPSQPMLDKARALAGVTPYNSDALAFSREPGRHYHKLLLLCVIHHLDQRVEMLKGFFDQLDDNGKILIVTRPGKTPLPFFKKALETFDQSQKAYPQVIGELESVGFSVRVEEETQITQVPRLQWYRLLRGRLMSNFHGLTNDMLEAGIEELEEKFEGREIIEVRDTLIFVLGER